mgnify:CR=1 FL=1
MPNEGRMNKTHFFPRLTIFALFLVSFFVLFGEKEIPIIYKGAKPSLWVIGFKESNSAPNWLAGISNKRDDLLTKRKLWELSEGNHSYYQITPIETSFLSLSEELPKIELNYSENPFFIKNERDYLSQRQTLTIKENQALFQLTYTERNETAEGNYSKIPYTPSASLTKSPQKASKLTNIATYLLIGGIVCLFLHKFSKTTPEGFSSDRRKIILARRKRWLKKIYNLGLIEKSTYQKMIRRLEDLPSLVEALGLRDQSKSSSAKGMEKDLKRAKSGESVVKTNEISDVKISR